MLAGVLSYSEAGYQRTVSEAPTIWRSGSVRLLDYGQSVENPKQIVLFVPSLINRYYILDLEEKRSFLRFLASQGIYPLVLDWGEPSEADSNLTTADYVEKILIPAVKFVAEIWKKPFSIAGYCMGGVMALAAAKTARKYISSLALLATPWDFSAPEFSAFRLPEFWKKELEKYIEKQKLDRKSVV